MNEILSQEEQGQILEIVNIGAGNASTALSHMLGKKIGMTVPKLFIGTIEEVHNVVSANDELAVSVLLGLEGDIGGASLMIFPDTSAKIIASLLTQNSYEHISDFKDEEISAMQEVGNILLGASITALSTFLGIKIMHGVPAVSVDLLAASLDEALIEMTGGNEQVILFNVDLDIDDKLAGNLYYFFDVQSSKQILKKTAEKLS